MNIQVRVYKDFDLGGGFALTQGIHTITLDELEGYEAAILDGRMFFALDISQFDGLNQQLNEQIYNLYQTHLLNAYVLGLNKPIPGATIGKILVVGDSLGAPVLAQVEPNLGLAIAGTNLNVILNEVLPSQTGKANWVLRTNGTTTSWMRVTQTLFNYVADVADVVFTGETDLYSDTIQANTLIVNGDYLDVFYTGTLGTGAGAKYVKVRFDNNVIFDSGLMTQASVSWTLQLRVMLTNTGTNEFRCTANFSLATNPQYTVVTVNPTTTAILKLTGESAIGAKVTAKFGYVKLVPAAV